MLQFSRRRDLQSSIRRLKAVVLFGPVFFELGEARWKEAFPTITDFTSLHVLSRSSK